MGGAKYIAMGGVEKGEVLACNATNSHFDFIIDLMKDHAHFFLTPFLTEKHKIKFCIMNFYMKLNS